MINIGKRKAFPPSYIETKEIDEKVNAATVQLAGKAAQADVAALSGKVDNAAAQIAAKAEKADVTALSGKVDSNTAQLADIAINALSKGIKGDGSDETIAINNLLATYKNVFFPKPSVSYTISDTINIVGTTKIKEGSKIEFAQGAILKQTGNKPAIKVTGQGHKVKNLTVDTSSLGTGFTASAILLASSSSSLPCMYNNFSEVNLIQAAKSGKAIELQSTNDGYVYYNKIKGTILYFSKGLYINGNSSMGINNNEFDFDINSSQQLINMTGGDGNTFRGKAQATSIDPLNTEQACVYVDDGWSNNFDMYIFDVGNPGLVKYTFEFTNSSKGNKFLTEAIIKPNYHYSNEQLAKVDDKIKYHKVISRFAGARQSFNNSLGWRSSPDNIDEYYNRTLSISPESNSIADKRIVQSVTATANNCAVEVGMSDLKNLFNHNNKGYLRYRVTDSSQPSSLTIDVNLSSTENVPFLGLILNPIISQYVKVESYTKNAASGVWTQVTTPFGYKIKDPALSSAYNAKDQYSFGSDIIFQGNSGINAVRFVLSLPALYATNQSTNNGELYEIYYLYVNCELKNAGRSNNAYPYIGGDIFTGDIEFHDRSLAGIVLKSPNGSRYRLMVDDAGVLSTSKI